MKFKIGIIIFYIFTGSFSSAKTSTSTINYVVNNIYELEELLISTQNTFLPITPPSSNLYIHKESNVTPVNWKRFPRKFTEQMYARMDKNGYPIYDLLIYEDPITRETVFFNSYKQEVYRLNAKKGYDPYAWQTVMFNLSSEKTLDKWTQWLFDPAHIAIHASLIPDVFYDSYLVMQEQEIYLKEDLLLKETLIPTPLNLNKGTDFLIESHFTNNPNNDWLDLHGIDPGELYEFYFTHNLIYPPMQLAHRVRNKGDNVLRWNGPVAGEGGRNRAVGIFKAYKFSDTDGDGLSDLYETLISKYMALKIDPLKYDTDEDGIPDGDEDLDGDGLTTMMEYMGLENGVFTHPNRADSDNDGLNDLVDPWPMDPAGRVDTDRDRMPNELAAVSTSYPMLIADLDDDNDGFLDSYEIANGLDPLNANSPGNDLLKDSDGDGLLDWKESLLGTDAQSQDTDGDGVSDGYEVIVLQTNPLENDVSAAQINAYTAVSEDADGDGSPYWKEILDSTNPNDELDFGKTIF